MLVHGSYTDCQTSAVVAVLCYSSVSLMFLWGLLQHSSVCELYFYRPLGPGLVSVPPKWVCFLPSRQVYTVSEEAVSVTLILETLVPPTGEADTLEPLTEESDMVVAYSAV